MIYFVKEKIRNSEAKNNKNVKEATNIWRFKQKNPKKSFGTLALD